MSLLEYEARSLVDYRTGVLAPRMARLHQIAQGDPDRLLPWDARNGMFLWDFFPPLYNCQLRERLGRFGDGGKVVCNLYEMERLGSACIVLSFGIRDDITFELALANRTRCSIHAFDPTIPRLPMPQRVPRDVSRRIFFHRIGIRGNSTVSNRGDGEYATFDAIMASLNLRRVHLLKLDVEGAEFDAIEQMRASGFLGRVDQLQIEIHFSQVHNRVSRHLLRLDRHHPHP